MGFELQGTPSTIASIASNVWANSAFMQWGPCTQQYNAAWCAVILFDPVYSVLDAIGKLPQDIQKGCPLPIAQDVTELVGGAAGTLAAGLGGVAGLRGVVASSGSSVAIKSVGDIFNDPQLLAGKTPAEVESAIGSTPGWRAETLGKGSKAGSGWVLRQYTESGDPTGLQIRWHPGGGHHGPDPYWRVIGPNGDLGGVIR